MKYYVVDAFTAELFSGNPAGVCVMDEWLPYETHKKIAAENNLSETAFVIDRGDFFDIRWFTPDDEFDLCGHATLASAFVIMTQLRPELREVRFASMSGELFVRRVGERFELDFPARPPRAIEPHEAIERAFGIKPLGVFLARDHVALLPSEADVRNLKPDFEAMRGLTGCIGLIATAKGDTVDFVSRYFSPFETILEDPVTGSAHCTLIPFWAERLGKQDMVARQLSKRGGTLYCRLEGDRVRIAGHAVLYSVGEIKLS